jgi:hypothetical protein
MFDQGNQDYLDWAEELLAFLLEACEAQERHRPLH